MILFYHKKTVGLVALILSGVLGSILILRSASNARTSPTEAEKKSAEKIIEPGGLHRRVNLIEEIGPTPSRRAIAPHEAMTEEDLFQQAMLFAKEELPSAYEWSQQLSDRSVQSQFLLFFGLALHGQKALQIKEWILKLPPENVQTRLLSHLGEEWTKQDPISALSWATQHPDAEWSKKSIEEFMNAWAAHDPPAATRYAASLLPENQRIRGLEIALDSWLQQNPKVALDEIQSWNDKERQALFGERLFLLQVQNDRSLFSEWLNVQVPGPFRDLGVHILFTTIYKDDPESAKKWSNTIVDQHLRDQDLQILKNYSELGGLGFVGGVH